MDDMAGKTKNQLITELVELHSKVADLEKAEAQLTQAEANLQAKTRQLESHWLISAEIARELDLTVLLGIILRRAAELLGARSGFLSLYDENTRTLSPKYWEGHGQWVSKLVFPLGKGISGAVAAMRRGMVVNNYRTSSYAKALILENTTVTSVVAEPLIYGDRVVGVVTVDNEGMTERIFTEEDRNVLTPFAVQAAIAIANARLLEEAKLEFAERTRTEAELKKSEGLYRTLIETSPDAIIVYDLTGRLITANMAAAKSYGAASVNEFLSEVETVFQVLTEKDRKKAATNLSRTLANGFSRKDEYLIRNLSGVAIHVEVNTSIMRGAQGEPQAFISVLRDITERKQSEKIMIAQRDLSVALAEAATLQDALRLCLGFSIRLAEFDAGSIYVIDPVTGNMTLACIQGVSDSFMKLAERDGFTQSRSQIIMQGVPYYVENEAIPNIPFKEAMHEEGLKSVAFIPIKIQSRIIGGLIVASHVVNHIAPYVRNALETIAGRIGTAIAKAQSEEALRESESKFRDLAEKSLVGIFLIQDDVHKYVNAEFAKIVGYRVEEIVDHLSHKDIVFQEDQPIVDKRVRLYTTGELQSTRNKFRIKTKDNELRDVETFSSRTFYQGRPAIIGSLLDITDRLKAEEALRESESKFRDLAEKSVVGIYLIQDDLFRYVNAEFANIFGYSVEELVNSMRVKDVIYQEDQSLVEEKLRQRISGELQSLRYEFRLMTKKKEVRHAEAFSSRTFYQGKPAVIGTVLDITDRLKAEEDLHRLSIAIEQAAEDIIITDPDGVIQYVNPAFEKITGYSRIEVIGKNPRILQSGAHDKAFYKQLWDTIKSGSLWSGRIINRCKDGRLVQEDATVTPLLTSAGKLTGYVALKRDVTQAVKMEGQLRQSQKMEAIGTLAGGIAHDFNNILGAIMGYAEMSKIMTTDPNIQPYLEQIVKAGLRSRDLIQQILTFSRKREQERKPVLVTPIVKEALKLLRSSIPATIEIRQHYNARKDTVFADPTQIHQILINLCTNAVHAIRDREGILEVSLGQHELTVADPAYDHDLKEGSYLKITVRDTGVGIDPAVKDKIFDPFFTTKELGEGTGLGLSVVYGIVKDHGGTISVESEVGNGTTFTVHLPLIVMDENLKQEEELESIPKGKGRILYVDDEELIAAMGQEWLTSLGYDVTLCLSGREALEAFMAHPEEFDLVITDMTMPNMTGASLAREILKIRPSLPIILTTGFSQQINEEEAKKIGIREFLMKPVSLISLAQTVKKITGQENISAAAKLS